jgi:hypothetical protein
MNISSTKGPFVGGLDGTERTDCTARRPDDSLEAIPATAQDCTALKSVHRIAALRLRGGPANDLQDERSRKFIRMIDAARFPIDGAGVGAGKSRRKGVTRRLPTRVVWLRRSRLSGRKFHRYAWDLAQCRPAL